MYGVRDSTCTRRRWWHRCGYRTRGAVSATARPETFATTARGLTELAQWLIGHGVTDVAMESTSVYWRPV